jgi:NADPH2:quinone reductase
MKTMKAMRIVPGPDGGRLEMQDVPVPTPGRTDVLVRVRAAGVNRGEINQVRRAVAGPSLPSGVEFAGEIAAVGDRVAGWLVGDRVMGHGPGGHAQYVLAHPLALMRVPASVGWVDAAAFPNVAITAHDALVTNAGLSPGESVLVDAASSGIGLASIAIARALGAAPVIAVTRSKDKVARLSVSGAHHVVDASSTSQEDAVAALTDGRGVDIVVDSVGASAFEANMRSLAIKGRLVNIGRLGGSIATIDLERLWLRRLRIVGVTFRTRTEAERLDCVQACARDVLPLFEEGRVRLPVEATFRLADLAHAHATLEAGRHVGKLVLTVE